jgi:hypothetical protein
LSPQALDPVLPLVSVLVAVAGILVASVLFWWKYLRGPCIEIIEHTYQGHSARHVVDHDVLVAWEWHLRILNGGSRAGVIRNSHIGIFEIEPQDINPQLEITCRPHHINNLYRVGEPQELMLTIGYIDLTPESLLMCGRIRKLTAFLTWDKETRGGFAPDNMRFKLIPELDRPPIW